ncbi:hypothetical protein [Algoriphagus boritolerans]
MERLNYPRRTSIKRRWRYPFYERLCPVGDLYSQLITITTGVYPWRNQNAKFLPGSALRLIDTAQFTLSKRPKATTLESSANGIWDWAQVIPVGIEATVPDLIRLALTTVTSWLLSFIMP